jgi:hypothetical protein
MKVVSEKSEAEIERLRKERERDRLTENLKWALRELTANLLRVCRGAGKPYEIGSQANAVVEAIVTFRKATGSFPDSYGLTNMLRSPHALEKLLDKGVDPTNHEDYLARTDAVQTIVRGALQIAASELLGQRTQVTRGEDELYQGIGALEKWRERKREQWAKEERARRRQASASRQRKSTARKRRPKSD